METRVPTLEMMLDGVLARKFFEQYPEIDENYDVILFNKGIAYETHLESVLCMSCKRPETREIVEMGEIMSIEWCPAVDGEIFDDDLMTIRKCKGDYYR